MDGVTVDSSSLHIDLPLSTTSSSKGFDLYLPHANLQRTFLQSMDADNNRSQRRRRRAESPEFSKARLSGGHRPGEHNPPSIRKRARFTRQHASQRGSDSPLARTQLWPGQSWFLLVGGFTFGRRLAGLGEPGLRAYGFLTPRLMTSNGRAKKSIIMEVGNEVPIGVHDRGVQVEDHGATWPEKEVFQCLTPPRKRAVSYTHLTLPTKRIV